MFRLWIVWSHVTNKRLRVPQTANLICWQVSRIYDLERWKSGGNQWVNHSVGISQLLFISCDLRKFLPYLNFISLIIYSIAKILQRYWYPISNTRMRLIKLNSVARKLKKEKLQYVSFAVVNYNLPSLIHWNVRFLSEFILLKT